MLTLRQLRALLAHFGCEHEMISASTLVDPIFPLTLLRHYRLLRKRPYVVAGFGPTAAQHRFLPEVRASGRVTSWPGARSAQTGRL